MTPLGRQRLVWNDKTILKEIELEVVNWIHLAQERDQWVP
jgi:hypothetical protein